MPLHTPKSHAWVCDTLAKLLVEKGSLPSALQPLQLLGNELSSRWFPDQGFRNSVSELDFPRHLVRRELIFKKFMEFTRREPDTVAELDIRFDDLTTVLVRDTADCYLLDRGVEVDGFLHYTSWGSGLILAISGVRHDNCHSPVKKS